MEYVYRFQRCPRAYLYPDSNILFCHHLPYCISYLCPFYVLAHYSFAPTRAGVCKGLPNTALHLFLKESPYGLLRQPVCMPWGAGKHVPPCRDITLEPCR